MMGRMDGLIEQAEREEALAYIRHALALCDRLGEVVAACHLQWSADLLEGGAMRDASSLPAR
jgi:hypothetical protein